MNNNTDTNNPSNNTSESTDNVGTNVLMRNAAVFGRNHLLKKISCVESWALVRITDEGFEVNNLMYDGTAKDLDRLIEAKSEYINLVNQVAIQPTGHMLGIETINLHFKPVENAEFHKHLSPGIAFDGLVTGIAFLKAQNLDGDLYEIYPDLKTIAIIAFDNNDLSIEANIVIQTESVEKLADSEK